MTTREQTNKGASARTPFEPPRFGYIGASKDYIRKDTEWQRGKEASEQEYQQRYIEVQGTTETARERETRTKGRDMLDLTTAILVEEWVRPVKGMSAIRFLSDHL
jgi:hypothetical protein